MSHLQPRLALNSQQSSFSLLNAAITGMHCNGQFRFSICFYSTPELYTYFPVLLVCKMALNSYGI